MMRYASVYQIKDKLVFCSNAQTVDGLSLSIAPYIHLPIDAAVTEIASALHRVIEANQTGYPHPKQTEWAGLSKQHLEGVGIKSMSVMQKRAVICAIAQSDTELTFTPSKKEGKHGAFLYLTEQSLTIPPASSSDKIAEVLREALRLSIENNNQFGVGCVA